MSEHLQTLFDHASKHAAMFFKETGELIAMWHAVASNDEHLVICTPWNNPDEKHAFVERLRQLFRARGVKRYAFMCEAWTLASSNIEEIDSYIGRVSEHPDRREILAVHAEDSDGHTIMGWYYILRPEHAPATLSPLHMSDATRHEGAFHGMLRHA